MIKCLSFLIFLTTAVCCFAADSIYSIEKEINLELDNSAQLQLEKEQIEQQMTDLQKKIREKKLVLLKRTRALSFLKEYQWGTLLSRVENPSQLDRNLKIFGRLSQYDMGLFKDYLAMLKVLSVARKDLEKTLQEISAGVQKLKSQQQELLTQENRRIQEVKIRKLDSLINLKGQLTRPLDGPLLWRFGARVDDSNQYVFVSKGLLYKALRGAPVKSVGPGRIIFRDVLQHWRETLIIEHQDHYYSVYSGLKSKENKVGDPVEKNQVLGSADSDEFYFELRHFDSPINPKNWFYEQAL